jgi:hypothetical protein
VDCRDRATQNTENAIQNAHQDNHSGKAMEIVLRHAQQQGVAFCPQLPLLPTLQDIKGKLTREARGEGGAAAPGPPASRNATVTDEPQTGESTGFLGAGKALRNGTRTSLEVFNAVGFFMFTQCAGNPTGEWPRVLCAPPNTVDTDHVITMARWIQGGLISK